MTTKPNYRHIPKPKPHQHFNIRPSARVIQSEATELQWCPKCGCPIAGLGLEALLAHDRRIHQERR